MLLNFIGNGSAFNVFRGNTSAYYKENDKLLLLDCGESIFERIVRLNLLNGVNEVYVAITHLHSDHAGSLSSLIYYIFYIKNFKVNLVADSDTKDADLKKLLEITGVKPQLYNWCGRNLNNSFSSIEGLDFVKVSHYKDLKESSAVEISLTDGRKIFFTGDTNDEEYISKVVANLNEGDELYCDTCLADYPGNPHTNVNKLASLVPIEKRKQVYTMHYDDERLLELIDKYGFNRT